MHHLFVVLCAETTLSEIVTMTSTVTVIVTPTPTTTTPADTPTPTNCPNLGTYITVVLLLIKCIKDIIVVHLLVEDTVYSVLVELPFFFEKL